MTRTPTFGQPAGPTVVRPRPYNRASDSQGIVSGSILFLSQKVLVPVVTTAFVDRWFATLKQPFTAVRPSPLWHKLLNYCKHASQL